MKITYVTPRYGAEVLGGAEYAARMLAERLVSQLGWRVDVLTSCALDATTWADEYAPGDAEINGVQVRRFPVNGPRHSQFPQTSDRVLAHPKLATAVDQAQWIDEQGPLAPGILDALDADTSDLVVFYPYLYYPTVRGLLRVAKRSILHPAAHDEAPIRLPVFAEVFGAAAGLVFQTEGERRLTEQLFAVADRPQLLLGLGVDPLPGDEQAFRTKAGLGDRPYIMCLGRVDDGKGAAILETYFAEYKQRHPGPLTLVFAGPVIQPRQPHPDVIVTGPVSEDEKWGGLRGAQAVISPSPFEAFSLVVIEAWAAGQPVLVNAACRATREHVERCGGGLWFDGYLSFQVALTRLLEDRELASRLVAAGGQYVDTNYRWPALIERYGRFLRQMALRVAS